MILQGRGVADAVDVCADRLVGYEIKGERDNVRRLPGQVVCYGDVFDEVSVVVDRRHVEKVVGIIPEWWGIVVADGELVPHRPAQANPKVKALALAQVFWLDEAVPILEARGVRGVRGKSRRVVQRRLVETLPLDELRAAVRETLLARPLAWARR